MNSTVENKSVSKTITNYLTTVQPDFCIHIGIKDQEIVKVDWNEMLQKIKDLSNNDDVVHHITYYLTKALDYINHINKTE